MQNSSAVLFEELSCQSGSIGLITLNRPETLNALSLEMFQLLHEKLLLWKRDPNIRLLFVHSSSPKAFSAGGDVKALAQELIKDKQTNLPERFFWWEYGVDDLIHNFGKPIACWMDGFTLGGGVGISNGASHRIVTEKTIWSMPELNIGFFPDVGAGYFLNQLPDPVALFLAWTGAPLSGADAIHLKLADACLRSSMKNGILNILMETAWSENADENHWKLTELLGTSDLQGIESHVLKFQERIMKFLVGPTPEQTFAKLLTWNESDVWARSRVDNARKASPLSAHVTYRYLKATRGLACREVLIKDWSLAVQMVRRGDFLEGIRAALIDKDQAPKWKHSSFVEVPEAEVYSLLLPHDDEAKFREFLEKQG